MRTNICGNILFKGFIFALILFLPKAGFSQIGDPGGDPGVPITGIEWLLLGGAAFGARKVYAKFKKPV